MRLIDADQICESIEKTLRWAEENGHKKMANAIIDVLIPTIACQPTVEAEPIRHGHWVEASYASTMWKCSVCGKIIEFGDLYEYCGKCGAKMDEVIDNE